ncbi:MAG: Fic family protein [Bacteroides sp.]|nr:Fic family protein [Bacteroides sp.]MCM1085710.1 Fic family protein [Bacteroides sp.]
MDKLEQLYKRWRSLFPLEDRKRFLLSQRFSVDYNFNSNHLEGNTLTYGQTELLLIFGKVMGEGDLKDYADMKASLVGMLMMQEQAELKEQPLTQHFIRQLHKVLLREDYTVYRDLPGGKQTGYTIHAGRYKTRPNSVMTRYGDRFEYASPEETPSLMADLVDWYNEAERSGRYTPVELAALFHYRYIRIHPFEDGNGRMARLLVNYILFRHDWPMVVVRVRNKQEYLEALHQSDVEVGDVPSAGARAGLPHIKHFLRFFKRMMTEELNYNIGFITETSENVWWYDGQKVVFRSSSTPLILKAINENPDITVNRIAEAAGIVPRAVKNQLRQMEKKGYIQRRAKDGSWCVFASQSI